MEVGGGGAGGAGKGRLKASRPRWGPERPSIDSRARGSISRNAMKAFAIYVPKYPLRFVSGVVQLIGMKRRWGSAAVLGRKTRRRSGRPKIWPTPPAG